MGISSLNGGGGSGGKYDELFKKSLLPKGAWESDLAWTKDTDTAVIYNEIKMLPTDTATIATNTSDTSNVQVNKTYSFGNTFTASGTYLLRSLTIKASLNPNPEDGIRAEIMTLDANGNPDLNNVLSKSYVDRSEIIDDGTINPITFYFDKSVQLQSGTSYAFMLHSNVDNQPYYVRYDATTTDTYTGGITKRLTRSSNAWMDYPSEDIYFVINGGTAYPSTTSAYTDIDNTVSTLDKLNLTTSTDGTNSVKVDLLDTSGGIVKENITPTTDLTEYFNYDKLRLKVTLDRNGSATPPVVTSYSLSKYLSNGTGTPKVFTSYAESSTALYPVCDVIGSGTLVGISQYMYYLSTNYAYLKVTIDGTVVYDGTTMHNLATYSNSNTKSFTFDYRFSSRLTVQAKVSNGALDLTTTVSTLLD